MKIAFAGSRGVPARYGGFETAVEEIGARLAARGHEVIVYCRRGGTGEAGADYRGMKRVVVPCLRRQSLETLSHTAAALWHAARHRPDVLIVMNPANGPLLALPRALGIPFAAHVDGLDWERSKWPPLGRRVIRFGAWCCTKLAPAIIADSRAIADFYRTHWRCESFYASYGAEPWTPGPPRHLSEYGLASRGFLLVVARLEPENNTDLIIRAHMEADSDLPLVIVGDAPYANPYVEKLKRLASPDRVRFLGAVYDRERLRDLLGHCYAYLHGHSVGGTNPILVEAMACRACVLYLDVAFNAEVCGEAGIPFPADFKRAADAIHAALANPTRAESLRAAAAARQASGYTWDGAADAYEALCRSLADTGRPSTTRPGS